MVGGRGEGHWLDDVHAQEPVTVDTARACPLQQRHRGGPLPCGTAPARQKECQAQKDTGGAIGDLGGDWPPWESRLDCPAPSGAP